MRALTMRRPWAELLLNGKKTLESRLGPVLRRHTGELAIHVAKRSPGYADAVRDLSVRFKLSAEDFAVPYPIDGRVVGVCLAGVTRTVNPLYDDLETLRIRACFEDIDDRYLTVITGARWLDEPSPASGMLSLWEWTP